MKQDAAAGKMRVGWREWIGLPQFDVARIKAKLDTGARTSALHATEIEIYATEAGERMVRFIVWPQQRSHRGAVAATAPLTGERVIRSSNGAAERRPVVTTVVEIGGEQWSIELTLASRDMMGFRLLLGRQALRGHAVIDPAASYRSSRQGSRGDRDSRKAHRDD